MSKSPKHGNPLFLRRSTLKGFGNSFSPHIQSEPHMVVLAQEALGAMPYQLRCTVELHLYLALLFITLS